ncbi:WapI family immunity protein [Alicyclobacillus fastidiosus]|uniref:Uncharacterized protein n=1 Tax=Alicyclobacillus fastidiosus TaxID=392011 RepID=A0ABV5AME0_9BACL|nr:hypothetical protein [Alicyclobacillus fastidiosus]WEH07980.1 hypothetical protein PYS47_14605 [Alicyclobacillus fastidiosus]
MNTFVLRAEKGCFIQVVLDEVLGFPNYTSPFGGYDVQGTVEIKSGSYYVKGELWFTTAEVYEFYNQLLQCWADLNGTAVFWTCETSLKVEVTFNSRGQVTIEGCFKEFAHEENELKFKIQSDQSFFVETIDGLKAIVQYYGDKNGIRKD